MIKYNGFFFGWLVSNHEKLDDSSQDFIKEKLDDLSQAIWMSWFLDDLSCTLIGFLI